MTSSNEMSQDAVTVSVSRKVLPGKEAEYEQWISGITEVAARFPGHMGINVLRPGEGKQGRYIVIYRYDSYENANRWEDSKERADWVSRLDGLVDGQAETKKVSGVEFWFDLPAVPQSAKPSQWRMAILITPVVYCLVLALSYLLDPLLSALPFWARLLVVIPVQVILMTFVVMPRLTQWLKHWIYPQLEKQS